MNKLVDKYIIEDNKEELINLVFEYKDKKDLNKIAHYFIDKKDDYNICELISIVLEYLDLDDIFDSIIKTNDDEFMFWIMNNGIINFIDEKYIYKIKKVLNRTN
jgi:hypothetical protein